MSGQQLQEDDDEAYVLYVDHQGHPVPLANAYHATASRRLASDTDRYPPSTITVQEVDSAFCRQCLSYHDAPTASRLGYCNKATCQMCPVCQSMASLTVDNSLCYYKCGLCDWTSKECNLSIEIQMDEEDGTVDRLELARAAEDLLGELNKRKSKANGEIEKHYKDLTNFWERKQTTTTAAGSSSGCISSSSSSDDRPTSRRKQQQQRLPTTTADPVGAWSVESLETALAEKKKESKEYVESMQSITTTGIHRPSLDDDKLVNNNQQVDESLLNVPAYSLRLQSTNIPTTMPLSRKDLLPLPVPLRARTSRRCRMELKQGRPGILLKPKLNPLEGDSSLRTGLGQWWRKDSSAVHVIPQVSVVKNVRIQQPTTTTTDGEESNNNQNNNYNNITRALLLKVTNPTLGTIRLRFAGSSYRGERDWDDPDTTNPLLSQLLVDTYTQKHVDAELVVPSSSSSDITTTTIEPTDSVELLSAEDSIIEMGGSTKARQVPETVANWDASAAAAAASAVESPKSCSLRVVAHSASMAWFELILADTRTKKETTTSSTNTTAAATAIPLSLQIEVGNGSWESSLIQPQAAGGDDVDRVTFDLVLVLGS